MAMTKKTVNVYSFVLTSDQITGLDNKINELTSSGATDGYSVRTENAGVITVTRHWLDQAAADEWQSWVSAYVAQFGYSYSSMTVENI